MQKRRIFDRSSEQVRAVRIFTDAVLLFVMLGGLTACGASSSRSTASVESVTVDVPLFNADSALLQVKAQTDFGARVPESEAHRQCALYLEEVLHRYGATVTVQRGEVSRYDGRKLPCVNLIGSYRPESANRILLCAHWDSRMMADNDPIESNRKKPVMGANDGASGVGVLLEIARHLNEQLPPLGVDIVFLDVEDQGAPADFRGVGSEKSWCLGTQYWASRAQREGYRARLGILLDMVGRKDALFYREGVSDYYAKSVVDKVWSTAARLGWSEMFRNTQGGQVTDDHLFINQIAGIPTIDIIDFDPQSATGFFEHWHTVNDTFEKIDKETLRKVGQTVLTVLYEER